MPRDKEYENDAERQAAYRARKSQKAAHQREAHRLTIDLMHAMRMAGYPVKAGVTTAEEYDEQILGQAVDFFRWLEPGTWKLHKTK